MQCALLLLNIFGCVYCNKNCNNFDDLVVLNDTLQDGREGGKNVGRVTNRIVCECVACCVGCVVRSRNAVSYITRTCVSPVYAETEILRSGTTIIRQFLLTVIVASRSVCVYVCVCVCVWVCVGWGWVCVGCLGILYAYN